MKGRVAGLDVGDRTIGIAVSDPLGWTAQGVEVLRRGRRPADDLARLLAVLKSREVELVVVGLPLNMNGSEGPRAQISRQFAADLTAASGLPVELLDERLTTAQAQRMLIGADASRRRRKEVVDMLAAQLILQSYLDRRNGAKSTGENR